MMSPYEGERIFEAEMVRLHQCDRRLYRCYSHPEPERSLWETLRTKLFSRPESEAKRRNAVLMHTDR